MWFANPYAAALLLPAAHLWLFVGAPRARLRGLCGWLALLAGLLGPLLVVLAEMAPLRIGPAELALALARCRPRAAHVTVGSALAAGVLAGCFATLVRVLRAAGPDRRRGARRASSRPAARRLRGPRFARRHRARPAA